MTGMLTVKETAETLGVKPSTVRAWIHRREKLEVVKVGRAVRIPVGSLRAFIRTTRGYPSHWGRKDGCVKMPTWMPSAMNPQLLQAAFGRPQNFAEKSQESMLEPINRYKSVLGRASTPAMEEALRRQTSPQDVAPEGQQYLPRAPLPDAGAAMGSYGRWGGYEDYTNPVGEVLKYQNLPARYFESAGAANPGWQKYQRIMGGPTAT